jgi:DNA-binding transcriptional ArsR family regulator
MRSHVRSATVSDLAAPFDITLTGLKKHLGVLEEVELITTEKIGRSRHCRLGPARSTTRGTGSPTTDGSSRPVLTASANVSNTKGTAQ